MKIKQAAAQLNVSQKTIRYYEQCGLITPVKELKMGREFRDYDEETMAQLRAVVVLRKLRFTVEDIQRIFDEPESIAEICDVHRQQMSEEIALMTDICALLEEIAQEEISQREIEDGQSLAMEIEDRHRKMVLERSLETSDLSKYDDSFIDYDLLEDNRTAEQSSRVALAVSQYFTNFKAVFRLSDSDEPGRWKYVILFSVLILSFLFLSFFDIFRSGGREPEPTPTEETIILSAENVSVAEEDYLTVERLRSLLRNIMIDHPDPAFLQNIEETLMEAITPEVPKADTRPSKVKEYNVSCMPLIAWNYEKNELDTENSGLIAFDDKQKFTYFLFLDSGTGSFSDVTGGKNGDSTGDGLSINGSYTMNLELLQKDARKRYLLTKADFWASCLIGEDGIAYAEYSGERDDTIQLKGDYAGKFDLGRIAPNLEEIVDPDNCIRISTKRGQGK